VAQGLPGRRGREGHELGVERDRDRADPGAIGTRGLGVLQDVDVAPVLVAEVVEHVFELLRRGQPVERLVYAPGVKGANKTKDAKK